MNLASDVAPFERVRVVLRRLDGSVAKDTVVPFPANVNAVDLTLTITLPLNAGAEGIPLALTMRYIDAAGDTVFSGGPVTVQAVPTGSGEQPTPVEIEVTYSGTGANAATVLVTPNTGTVVAGSTTQFSAIARDLSNTILPNTPVLFTSPDAAQVTVTAGGLATWLPVRGPTRIIGTLLTGDDADTVSLTVTLPATQLLSVGGDAQTGIAAAPLADSLLFRVAASDGVGVAGHEVTFAVTTGAGTLSALKDTSDVNGLVSTKWTLGIPVGAQSVTATVTGIASATRVMTATAVAGTPVRLEIANQPGPSHVAGATFAPALTVRAADAGGNTVTSFTGNVSVILAANPGGTEVLGTTTVAAVAGVATFNDLNIERAGVGYTIAATSSGLVPDTTGAITIVNAAAVTLATVSGDGQSGTILTPLAQPFRVVVTDAFGNPVAGVTVTWTLGVGGGALSVPTSLTDASGEATSTLTLPTTAGAVSATANVAGLTGSPRTFLATALPGPAAQLAFTVQPQNVVAGATMAAVQVVAQDALGNLQPAFSGPVTLALSGGNPLAVLGGTTTVAAVGGVANFTDLAIDTAATGYQLVATAVGPTDATSTTFDVGAGAAVQLVFTQQVASATATVPMSSGWTVVARDALGNSVPGYTGPVSIALAGGDPLAVLGGTTSRALSGGTATFDDLVVDRSGSGYTLTAAGAGVSSAVSSPFTVGTAVIQWINSAGGNWSTPANWDLGRVPMAADSVVIAASGTYTVTVDVNATAASIRVGGAGGTQTLFASSRTISAVNGVVVTTSGVLSIVSTAISGPVTNAGAFTVAGNGNTVGGLVTNAATGTLTVAAVVPFGDDPAALAASGGLVNSGSVVLTNNHAGGTFGAALTVTGGPLVNAPGGVVSVTPGVVGGGARTITATLDNQGTVTATTALSLSLSGSSQNTGLVDVVAGAATLTQPGGASFVQAGTVTVAAGQSFTLSGGAVTLDATSVLGGAGTVALNSTTVTLAAGQSRTVGTLTLASTTVNGTGTLTNAVGGTLGFRGAVTITVPVTNAGAFTVAGNGNTVGGLVTNAATGTLTVAAVVPFGDDPAALAASGGLVNSGSVVLTNNHAGGTFGAALTVTGGPLVNAPGGVVSVTPGVVGGGARTITATLDNQGTLDLYPGTTGTLNLTGSLTNSGNVTVDIGAGPTVDLLAITGTVTLGGTLDATLLGGFVPPNGSGFTFLTHSGTRTGTFATVNVPAELSASPSYLANSITLDAAIGAGIRLGAGTQPVGVNAGDTAPLHSVTVRDAAGSTVTGATGTVTVSIDSGPAGGTILGTTTVPIASGVAEFATNQFVVAGDYRLRYTSAGLADTVSAVFTVAPAAPNSLVILSGNTQSVQAFQPAPDSLRVRLIDGFGNGIPGTVVNFIVTAGDPTASPAASLTSATGFAAARLTMGETVGSYTVEATSSGVSNVVFIGTTLPTIANMVWTGDVSSSIADPANWLSNTVPVSADSILVPAGRPNYPVLPNNIQVAWATIEPGATVTVGNFFLGLTRGLDTPASASILADTGGILLNGPAGTVRGRMPKLYLLNGSFVNDGPLVVDSTLISADNATMAFGATPVTIGLDLITTNSGKIAMGGGSSVSVGRNALFDGGNTSGLLTGGTLSVAGNFVTTGTGDQAAFSASAAHVVELVGTTTQSVQLAFPDIDPISPCTASCFGILRSLRSAGQGIVNFTTDAKAFTALEITGDGLNAPGRTILGGGTPNLSASTVIAAKIGWQTGLIRGATFNVDTLVAWGNAQDLIAGETIPTIVTGGVYRTNGNHPAPLVIAGFGGQLDVVGTATIGTGTGDALTTRGDGRVNMFEASDSLVVNGNALFNGISGPGLLAAGVIEVNGDFTQGGSGVTTFSALPAHRLRILGVGRSIGISDPVNNPIGTLDLAGISSVTFLGGGRITGDVTVGASLFVVGGGAPNVEIGGNLIEPLGGRWQVPNTVFIGANPSLPTAINGNVAFGAGAVLDADFAVAGDLTVPAGTLDLNGNRVVVGGAFATTGPTATLRMVAAADTLSVLGDFNAAGGSTEGLLTAGRLEVNGNFTASAPGSFAASGTHETWFVGTANQLLSFSTPGFGAGQQRFANLGISQGGPAEVQILSDVFVDGQLLTEPAVSLRFASAAPRFINARGADIDGLTFSSVLLALTDGTAVTALANLTFADQDPTLVQFAISRSSGSYALTNPVFSTIPTTGRYLQVVDSDGGTDLLVSVTNPTPSVHGGFLEVLGGATVTGWNASVGTQLAVATAAAGAASGAAFTTQPVVEIRDAQGNVVTTDNSTVVTLTVDLGATVLGGTTATAVNGVATFATAGVSGTAGAYTLTFSSGGLTAATQGITLTAAPATLISWTGSVNNSWSNTANWDLNRLPIATDSVVINVTDTVNVTTAATVGWLIVGESSSPLFTIGAGATLAVDTAAVFGSTSTVTMTGGTLTGGGSASILGTLLWSGGTMSGTGGTLVAPSATATITGAPTLNTRTFTVAGDATLGGTAFNGSNVVGQTPTLVVLAGGTLEFTSTTSYFSGNGVVDLVNAGTLRKAASAGLVRVDWPIANTGTLEIVDDSLDLRNSLTHVAGTISILANAALVNGGNTVASAPITIAAGGAMTLQSGGISVDAGNHIFGPTSSVSGLGKLRINSADTTRIQGGLDIDSLTVQNGNTWFEGPDTMFVTRGAYLGGGFFRGSGVLGIRGDFALNPGNVVGTGGTMSVRPTGTLTLRGMSGWTVDVEGTAIWGDYDMTFTQDTLNGVPYASLRVRSGGLLDVQHGAFTPRELFALGSATYPNVVFTIDAGATVRKSTGSGVSNFRSRFEMAGIFDVLSGSINIQGTCAMTGTKTGAGSVSGNCGSFP